MTPNADSLITEFTEAARKYADLEDVSVLEAMQFLAKAAEEAVEAYGRKAKKFESDADTPH
jgi:hypothetical protein